MESTSSARKEHRVLLEEARSTQAKSDPQLKLVTSCMQQLLQRTHAEILLRDACQQPQRNRATLSNDDH